MASPARVQSRYPVPPVPMTSRVPSAVVVSSSADDIAVAPDERDFSYKSSDDHAVMLLMGDDGQNKVTVDVINRAVSGASIDHDRRTGAGRVSKATGHTRRGSGNNNNNNNDGVCDDDDDDDDDKAKRDDSCHESPRGSDERRRSGDRNKGRQTRDSKYDKDGSPPSSSTAEHSNGHHNKQHNSPRRSRPSGGGGGHEADIPENAEPSEVLGLGAVVPKGMIWNVPTEVCVGDKYVIIGRCPSGAKPVSIDLWATYPKDKAISVKMFMSLRRFQISAKCDGKPKACTCPAKDEAYPFEKDREFKIIIAVTKECYVVKFYGTKGQGSGSMKHVIPIDEIDTFSISNTEMIFKALKYC